LKSWYPVSDRLLVAKFKHSFGTLTVIVAYALTNDTVDNIKDEFYQSLDQITQRLSSAEVVMCLGDFNAVTDTSRDGYTKVIGPHSSGIPNENMERMLNFCAGRNFNWQDQGLSDGTFTGTRGTPMTVKEARKWILS